MAEVHIQAGMTDGFGYIGAQPPLTEERLDLLRQAEYMDSEVLSQFTLVEPHSGDPYSEASFSSDDCWPRAVASSAIERAEKVARILRHGGDTVTVDRFVYPIGSGFHLFGGEAERLG